MTTALKMVARGGAGIESLQLREVSVPAPVGTEVLVRLRAATLNYRDLIGLRGSLPGLTKEPDYIPLSCACGEVIAIGDGVTRVQVGQRVAPQFAQGWLSGGPEQMTMTHLGGSIDGVARTHAIFSEEGLALVPDELSDLEAATLPCAGLTAWSALHGARATKSGDVVLVQGTGGVAIAALQLAKAAGAEVIVTSSSDAKLKRARFLGADHLINYRLTPDWPRAVRALTQGRGADLIVDVVGGLALELSAAASSKNGMIAAIGMLGGNFSWGLQADVPVVPVTVGNREQFESLFRALAINRVRPVVDQVYPLAQLGTALGALERAELFGKIGILLD